MLSFILEKAEPDKFYINVDEGCVIKLSEILLHLTPLKFAYFFVVWNK